MTTFFEIVGVITTGLVIWLILSWLFGKDVPSGKPFDRKR